MNPTMTQFGFYWARRQHSMKHGVRSSTRVRGVVACSSWCSATQAGRWRGLHPSVFKVPGFQRAIEVVYAPVVFYSETMNHSRHHEVSTSTCSAECTVLLACDDSRDCNRCDSRRSFKRPQRRRRIAGLASAGAGSWRCWVSWPAAPLNCGTLIRSRPDCRPAMAGHCQAWHTQSDEAPLRLVT